MQYIMLCVWKLGLLSQCCLQSNHIINYQHAIKFSCSYSYKLQVGSAELRVTSWVFFMGFLPWQVFTMPMSKLAMIIRGYRALYVCCWYRVALTTHLFYTHLYQIVFPTGTTYVNMLSVITLALYNHSNHHFFITLRVFIASTSVLIIYCCCVFFLFLRCKQSRLACIGSFVAML